MHNNKKRATPEASLSLLNLVRHSVCDLSSITNKSNLSVLCATGYVNVQSRRRYCPILPPRLYSLSDAGVQLETTRVSSASDIFTPGSPWENGFVESFNGTMANELLNREIFDTLHEAKVLLARWVLEYNTKRPHSALGYRPPAPEAYLWAI